MEKKDILKRVKQTYCRLSPSKISGVGVVAIRDIPKDINPFKGIHEQRWQRFDIKELRKLEKNILKMIDDFFIVEKDNSITIPEFGLNGMDISFFLNHSKKPNIKTKDGYRFITLRKIKKGEELLVAYETFDFKYKE